MKLLSRKKIFYIITFFVSLSTLVLLFKYNEHIELICKQGKSTGAAAQNVCLKRTYVLKSSKSCGVVDLKCKWTLIKQRYTYKNWEEKYNGLDIISNVSRLDKDHVIMSLEKNYKGIHPDTRRNREMLIDLQKKLEENNHLLLDAYPETNAFLDKNGRIKLIDFTIVPYHIKYLPVGIKFLDEFPNIAAGDNERFKKWYKN